MKKCLITNDIKKGEIPSYLGNNLLKGIRPVILDCDDNELVNLRHNSIVDLDWIFLITGDYAIDKHIDFESPSCKVIFDLKEEKQIDRIFISGFYNGKKDYSIAEYKLYIASDPNEIFKEENLVVHYNNGNLCEMGSVRNHCDQVFDLEDWKGRYFALHIIKSNITDDIARVTSISLFNHKYSEQTLFCKQNFEYNILNDKIPTVKGTYSKDLTVLTDGICFDEKNRITLNADTEFTYRVDNKLRLDSAYVVGSQSAIDNCEISAAIEKEKLWTDGAIFDKEICEIPNSLGGSAAMFLFSEDIDANFISFRFKEGDYIDQLGVVTPTREVGVDANKILCEDFYGLGVNCLPMALMPESRATGYNEVYWELERKRIIMCKPSVARLWYQPDWTIENLEDYKAGIYNFDAPKMESVYKYLDAFKEAGTEIELNFGWKASKDKCEWFNLQNPDTQTPWNSAPDHLDLFAKCCSATIKELVVNRGYDNIKYLAFYNEANYGEYGDKGDYNIQGRKVKPYYAKMFRMVMEQMKEDGTYSLIKPWAAEISGYDHDQLGWTKFIAEELSEYSEVTTHHRYSYSYDELMDIFAKHKALSKNGKMMLTEYGIFPKTAPNKWDYNHISYTMAFHNSGYLGGLIWCMSGVHITDPCSFTMRNVFGLWDVLTSKEGESQVERVANTFYENSLIMKYVPTHAKSIGISCAFPDIRTAAWTFGDDISIAVQSKENPMGRQIEINLGQNIDKPVYRHIYKDTLTHDGNAIIPVCDKVINVTDTIYDEIDGDYQMAFYTTIPPVTQVEFDNVTSEINAGQSIEIKAHILDGNDSDELEWSIACALGAEGTLEKGVYTADKKAKAGDMIAIKAEVKGKPHSYGIKLIQIK